MFCLRLARVLALVCLLFESFGFAINVVPTTTVTQLKANSTSAASTFPGLGNGVPAPGSVSNVPVVKAMYPGATTRVYAHLMGWFGTSSHLNVGYNSNDPNEVSRQVKDMMSRGINGAVLTWKGPNNNPTQQTAQLLMAEAAKHPGFQVAMEEEVGAVGAAAIASKCNITAQVISDVNYILENFATSPAYMLQSGRPVIFFFGLEAYYADWTAVRAGVHGNPVFVFRNASAFTNAGADAGYSWVSITAGAPYNEMLTYLDGFYAAAVADPAKATYGSMYAGFNDNQAGWGSNRIIARGCGKTWLDSLTEAGKYYSASRQLASVQLVTWNDYEEGTAIEPGINSCLTISPAVGSTAITWKVGGYEAAIDHYSVYISTDGQNVMKLADVTTHELDLSHYQLATATYTLYVRAVGKGSIQNVLSPAVTYRPDRLPPSVKVTATPLSAGVNATVTATVSASTGVGASISQSQIDFGDGTMKPGPVATHAYAKAGPHTITATATDSTGMLARATVGVKVAPVQAGVVLQNPGTGTLTSPVNLSALATSSVGIEMVTASVDGVPLYTVLGDTLQGKVKITNGNHVLAVDATDMAGVVYHTQTNISVFSNSAPIAVLGLSTVGNATTVLACSAASQDTGGSILKSTINFGDGTVATGYSAVHDYGAPGTHVITTTVVDDHGRSSSASATVVVGN